MGPTSLKFLGLPMLAWVPLFPLVGAFINLTLGKRFSKGTAHTVAIAAVAASCALAIYLVAGPPRPPLQLGNGGIRGAHAVAPGAVAAGAASCALAIYLGAGPLWQQFKLGNGGIGIEQTVYTWIEVGTFKAQLAFRLDTLSAVMILIVTFIGSLIHIYSTGYMHNESDSS